ncbi:MAG: hypothetical protein ABI459_06250 [Deltaproteobacteria bacterium]
MSYSTKLTAILALTAGLSGFAGAAFATDTSQAIKLCDANPNCKHYQDGIKITLTVKYGKDTKQVECPSIDGECSVVLGPGVKRNSRIAALLKGGALPMATATEMTPATDTANQLQDAGQ